MVKQSGGLFPSIVRLLKEDLQDDGEKLIRNTLQQVIVDSFLG